MTKRAEPSVWDCTWTNGDHHLHITPPDDLILHELDEDCVCCPYREDLGRGDILFEHSALDGRP